MSWHRAAIMLTVIALGLVASIPAHAHQPVILGEDDSSPRTGPMLPDGTVSYAVSARVEQGDQRGFRFRLKQGDRLEMQFLIRDAAPANTLPVAALPHVVVVDPAGRRTSLTVNERSEFFEPYSQTAYLYLSRLEGRGTAGTYQVIVKGRSDTPVDATVAVGYREVPGKVIG